MEKGHTVKSRQSGFNIDLPPKKVATVKVTAFFGDNENNEGSVCETLSGTINPATLNTAYVEEVKP
jgi:hypothetical protein